MHDQSIRRELIATGYKDGASLDTVCISNSTRCEKYFWLLKYSVLLPSILDNEFGSKFHVAPLASIGA